MKRVAFLLVFLSFVLVAKSGDYISVIDYVNHGYISYSPNIQDVPSVRSINGGTVIIPIFDESCPENIKAPFSYACKIVEGYLPPCLPIKVQVSTGLIKTPNGTSGINADAIAIVSALSKENFGRRYERTSLMSNIKGVIISELGYNSTVTYLDSVPNVEFLTSEPDIKILYNERHINDFSTSLDVEIDWNYDFVSVAIRNMLIGLGLMSQFQSPLLSGELQNPSRPLIPFEAVVNGELGYFGDGTARLEQATKGVLLLKENALHSLKLYAPSNWKNEFSLHYFVPQEDSNVSKILSYNFSRGDVFRALSDEYDQFIFKDLLGWKPDYLLGSGTSASSAGSTSLIMPYKGTISLNSAPYGLCYEIKCNSQQKSAKSMEDDKKDGLRDYLSNFFPYQPSENGTGNGISVSVLKKDGTWDLVKSFGFYFSEIPSFSMSDCVFHYDESEYARTPEGYLRGRITTKNSDYYNTYYESIFFVIDYLPQKVVLTPVRLEQSKIESANKNTVRLYFSNTEGVNRLVLRESTGNEIVDYELDIDDIKKGVC